MRLLLACDLDGTLLVSARKARRSDICVEHIGDRQVSFLTRRAVALLRELPPDVLLVPVTSRSVRQYLRIRWPEGTELPLAAVANGMVLLRGGVRVPEWRRGAPLRELKLLRDEMLPVRSGICRVVDGAYAFRVDDGESPDMAVPWDYNAWRSGRKLYLLPPGADKAAGLRAFCKALSPEFVAAAGDTAMDAGMLDQADFAFVPHGGVGYLRRRDAMACPAGKPFSEFVLEQAIRLSHSLGDSS